MRDAVHFHTAMPRFLMVSFETYCLGLSEKFLTVMKDSDWVLDVNN